MNEYKIKTHLYSLIFFLLTTASGNGHADDTEIYFNPTGSNSSEIRPNVLLILDSSGSMGFTGGTAPSTRMEVMREAMLQVINDMEDVNVGLMRFTFIEGGSVLFPIKHIDAPAGEVVSEPADNGIQVSHRTSSSLHDAAEDVSTGTVTTTSSELSIPTTEAVSGSGTINRQIASSVDDAYEFFDNVSDTFQIWQYGASNANRFRQGLHFSNITVPQGATIDSSSTTWTVERNFGTPETRVRAEKVDSAVTWRVANGDIAARPVTTNSIIWSPTGGNESEVTSPSLNSIIQELVNQSGWSSGSSLNLISTTNRCNFCTGSKRFYSFDMDPSKVPKLQISYSGGAAKPATSQIIGLHYPDVKIPQGATITGVKLSVTSKSSQGGDGAAWLIRADAADNSSAISATNNNLSSRAQTSKGLIWTVPDMLPQVNYESCNEGTCSGDTLVDVIQEVVNRSGWCGGNDLTLLINQSAAGTRNIHSFESDSTASPRLEITYDAGTGGCYEATETAQISANFNDVHEENNGKIERNLPELQFKESSVALRFQAIDIPKGSTILSAELELEAAKTKSGSNPTVEIFGINVDSAQQFTSTPGSVTSVAKTSAKVAWSMPDFSTDSKVISPDIKNVVQEIVDRNGWVSGNNLGLFISDSLSGSVRKAKSHDQEPNASPKLRITFRSTTGSGKSVPTVRDRLIELVNEIPTRGGTPITEALYEAALYWRGDEMKFGHQRGKNFKDQQSRISHPGSYCLSAGNCPGANVNIASPSSQKTDAFGVHYPTNCDDNNLDAFACRTQEIKGTPKYLSPFTSSATCASNFQVLLTDGEAFNNSITDKSRIDFISGGGACETSGANRGNFSFNERCSYDIVEFLNTNDQNTTLDNSQTVKTYTIGFNTGSLATAQNFLQDLADVGEGEFFEASSASDLVAVFTEILTDVKNDPTSFVSPSLATNAFNRLLSRNEAYFGLFTPSFNKSWLGNSKKYNLCINSQTGNGSAGACTLGNILDKNGVDAIDQITNKFKTSAQSEWSTEVDGRFTTKGGAGAAINNFTLQKFYTDATDSGAKPALNTSLESEGHMIDKDKILDSSTAHISNLVCPDPTNDSDCRKHLEWMLGKVATPAETDFASSDTRWSFHDVLHSSPSVITYGFTTNSGTIEFFDRLVVGTNDGALRFINGSKDAPGGKQEWAFFPKTMLSQVRHHLTNAEGVHLYGLDTAPTVRIKDHNNDGIINPTLSDFVHVYIGMRRGGNAIYALDVSPTSLLTDNIDADDIVPKFLWSIEGGTAGFELLGDTWSKPQLINIKTKNDGNKDVLVFGGGYNDIFDDAFSPLYTNNDNRGNAVYFVDPDTGRKLFSVGGPCLDCDNPTNPAGSGLHITHPDMKFSIPSRITALDSNGDGTDDRLYFGDVGGQVWRIDLKDVDYSATTGSSSSVVGKLAKISGTDITDLKNQRKFLEAPSVVQVRDTQFSDAPNGEYDYVLIGTGDRTSPLSLNVHDRFYGFRDEQIGPMSDGSDLNNISEDYETNLITHINIGDTALIDVTNEAILSKEEDKSQNPGLTPEELDSRQTNIKLSSGWFYNFNTATDFNNGEKVLASPTTIDGTVFFTTYSPESTATDPCAANIGGGFAYNMDVVTTKAGLDLEPTKSGRDYIQKRKKKLGGGIPSDVVPIFTSEGVVGIVGTEGGANQLGKIADLPRYRTYWYDDRR